MTNGYAPNTLCLTDEADNTFIAEPTGAERDAAEAAENADKTALREMTDDQLRSYNRICKMGLRCISSSETRALNKHHLQLTSELLEERRAEWSPEIAEAMRIPH
jgi:hypothetical protein